MKVFEIPSSLMILSGVVLLGALMGGAVPFLRQWKQSHLYYFISFGAGVLMATAFIYMVPEATEILHGQVGMAVLAGFLLFYFLERFIMIHPCVEEECEYHHIGIPAFVGFSFHNLTDGIALGASFLIPSLTPFVFLALICHHIPTSFAFTSILKVSRYSVKKTALFLLIATVMIPVGAFVSNFMLGQWGRLALGWSISLSAGIFIHMAICDLLPQVHKSERNRFKNTVCFVLGLGMMTGLSLMFHHHSPL